MKFFLLFILSFILISCGEEVYHYDQNNALISAEGIGRKSTTAGNLITTAIKEVHRLDAVLYPTDFISTTNLGLFSTVQDNSKEILDIFASGAKDKFVIGYMSGADLKEFIRQRTIEKYAMDLEVAGIHYDIMFKGGMVVSENYAFEGFRTVDDNKNYIVALAQNYLKAGGGIFPPYEFRNNITGIFTETKKVISASEALKDYLKSELTVPNLKSVRARVRQARAIEVGFKAISEIQGISFLSPFNGDKVTTEGIVTAAAELKDYPAGFVAYIQSEKADGDIRTSEAIKLYFSNKQSLVIGDKIQVSGTVYEEADNKKDGLTVTSMRDITELVKVSSGNPLPAAVRLGVGGRYIPSHHFSTHVGNLNLKDSLELADALDFWESLEGMRVTISDPVIVGFRGGQETFNENKPHLTLNIVPKNHEKEMSDVGGILAKPNIDQFNPEIMTITTTPITKGLNTKGVYHVGQEITGDITGILTYTKNLFGEGEYLLQLPEGSSTIDSLNSTLTETIKDISERPKLAFEPGEDHLTIASYNIKNLSSIKNDEPRLKETARMINVNLKCPDILGLVEVQDNNGEDFNGRSNADQTIKKLINYIPDTDYCSGKKYKAVNINPLSHREGGVPGANIRVAIIFDENKVRFDERPAPTPISETFFRKDGKLNYNPGRVFPNSEAFQHTRRSIVAEFEYKNKPVYVIVNHFNSKLGDGSHFSSVWPVARASEEKRAKMAAAVNTFVSQIERNNTEANIAVIGDFNAYVDEAPMRYLEGDILYNLMRSIPENDRYSTNHNGNSQSLDYIFVNKNLRQKLEHFQVPQLNSDFMGRLSDHDPVISVFSF